MFRRVSNVEVAEVFGAMVREQPKGYYRTKFFTTGLDLELANLLPIARDDRPFRLRPTATNITDPELSVLLENYPGIEYIELYGGDYNGDRFRLAAPSVATSLLIVMMYDVESAKKYKEQFSQRHDAQWYYNGSFDDAKEDELAFYDCWIIPRTAEFDELLERHSQNFEAAVTQAEDALRVYDAHRWKFREYVKTEQAWRIERLGWSIRLYDIEAHLLYIRGDGLLDEYTVRYDAYGIDQLSDLLYIAEEFEELCQAGASGYADVPEAEKAL